MKKKYFFATSTDGRNWETVAGFNEGENSRWGPPIDDKDILLEAQNYLDTFDKTNRPVKHFRLITQFR